LSESAWLKWQTSAMPVFGAIVLRYITVLDGEALQLLALGFCKVVYLEIYCPRCGSIRIALELAPDSLRLPCPICRRSCPCSSGMCVGYSRKALPFFEVWAGPLPADRHVHRHWRKIAPPVNVGRMRAKRC
jgi:hypothetical protein